jgi:hypothetical protein
MATNLLNNVFGREGRDKENSQEGRQGFEIAQLIKTLVPTEAILTKLSLLSCNSGDCTVGVTNMVADVKTLFKRFVAIQGYQGTVNVGSNGKPGMAPSDIDSLRKKSEELGQQLDELTDKMEERIAVQSQALNNTVPQTQTANTIQTVATLEKKIQADNQAIDEETQAAETVKQIVQKEQVKTSLKNTLCLLSSGCW